MALRAAPFQLPPSQRSVGAMLQRMQNPQRMATGGKPVNPPYVAPQNPPVATPYAGDITHYGEGPEHDFFVTPPPPVAPPPVVKPPPGGTGDDGDFDPKHPWNQQPGGNPQPTAGGPAGRLGIPADNPIAIAMNRAAAKNVPPPAPPPRYQSPQMLALLNAGRQGSGLPQLAQQQPPAAPAPAQSTNPLTRYLQGLGDLHTGQGYAAGGAVDPGAPDSAARAIASLSQVPPGQHGEKSAGLSGQDQANADVAVHPSLKSALSIGSMIAGMAMAPAASLAMTGIKMGIGALTGNMPTDPFDVPGPRLTADQQQAAIDAYNNTAGPVTNKKAAYTNAIDNARTLDSGGQLGGPGPGLSAGTGVDTSGHTYSSNIGGAGVSHNLAGGASAGGGDRAGGGYGGQGGDIGSGRGDMSGGEGPNKGGLYRAGGRIRHLAQGGLPRFPSIRLADGGSADQQLAAEQAQQAEDARLAPTPGEFGADVGDAYRSMALNSAAGPIQLLSSRMPVHPHRMADGGSMDASNQFLDASSQSMDQPMPAAPDTTNSAGFSSQLLPFLAGYQGGPAAIGAATALTGGTIQDAASAASLMYRSGAANQPHAHPPKAFDPNENKTSAILQSLAQQTGISNRLKASAVDPSGTMSMASPAQGYSKPTVRNATHAVGGGGIHEGAGPVVGDGDGQEDKIDAKLSDGEYVWSAQDVSDLGNGSNSAGAKRLDQMRQMVRSQAGRKNTRSIAKKQPDVANILARCAGGRV